MLCLLQGNCGKRVQIRRTLLNVPDVVSIGLVWGSDRPDLELTTEVAKTIGTTLLLPDVSTVWRNDRGLFYLSLSSIWVKAFRIIPEFSILRLTFHRKTASKC